MLQQEVAGCTLCGELAATRTQTVFGVGNPQARLCFLGEAPGADEDRQGEPFVGRAGQLLNKILEACRLRREDVYILNILKCRPPGNRNPLPDEANNCRRFLDRQLELIGPEFICCLGAVAAQNLLGTTEAIGRMRGKVLELPRGDQGRVHLSPGVSAAESVGQEVRLGRHEAADARDGHAGGLKLRSWQLSARGSEDRSGSRHWLADCRIASAQLRLPALPGSLGQHCRS